MQCKKKPDHKRCKIYNFRHCKQSTPCLCKQIQESPRITLTQRKYEKHTGTSAKYSQKILVRILSNITLIKQKTPPYLAAFFSIRFYLYQFFNLSPQPIISIPDADKINENKTPIINNNPNPTNRAIPCFLRSSILASPEEIYFHAHPAI